MTDHCWIYVLKSVQKVFDLTDVDTNIEMEAKCFNMVGRDCFDFATKEASVRINLR